MLQTFGQTATASDADFGTLREHLERLVGDHRSEHPEREIVGYVLRYSSPVGSVDFPEPGRRTKRSPDKDGVCRMSAAAFYCLEPIEFPRVPVKARYEIWLVDEHGKLIRTLNFIHICVAFPSVRLYDEKFHYDYKGRILWANDALRAKPRRRRHSRRIDDAVPSQTEQEPAVPSTPPAPIAKATAAAVNQPETQPASSERPYAELGSRFDQLQQTLASERAARGELEARLDRLQREREDDRQRFRAQKAELDEVKGLNKLLAYRNKRLQAERLGVRAASSSETFAQSQPAGLSTVAVTPPPVEVACQNEPPTPVGAALANEAPVPLATATPIVESDPATPVTPIAVAQQDEPSSLTSSESTPPQIAETRASPAPKTDPPKPDWKSGGRSRNRQKQTAGATPPKKPPDGPLFGLAADNWRTSHRIR